MKEEKQSFWDHLDELRNVFLRIIIAALLCGIVAFFFKEQLFAVMLAPKESGFITYRLLDRISSIIPGGEDAGFYVQLINTGLAQQFMIHMKTALLAGILCASPYIIYQLFRFVSPALYSNEKAYAVKAIGGGYLMFMTGVAVSYFIIFPLTFRFLGTYQVAGDVTNMISIESYMEVLAMMSISMGIVFEMPVLAWLFARLGFLTPHYMTGYRKHAIVVILIIAAIITPTSDIFTLLAVSMPMYLLYEGSILLVRLTTRRRQTTATPTPQSA